MLATLDSDEEDKDMPSPDIKMAQAAAGLEIRSRLFPMTPVGDVRCIIRRADEDETLEVERCLTRQAELDAL